MCGARALLTIADVAPPQALLLTSSSRMDELVYRAAETHAAKPFVLAACCDLLATIARERMRELATGSHDLAELLREGKGSKAARVLASALASHPSSAEVVFTAIGAIIPLVQLHWVVGEASRAKAGGGAPAGGEGRPSARRAATEGEGQALLSAADLQSLQHQIQQLMPVLQAQAQAAPGAAELLRLAQQALQTIQGVKTHARKTSGGAPAVELLLGPAPS